MNISKRLMLLLLIFICGIFPIGSFSQLGTAAWAEEHPSAASQDEQLPLLQPGSPDYRTPLAGEGFRAKVFGKEITVHPRDRRSVSDWDLGAAVNLPTPDSKGIIPMGAIYLWRHPNDQTLFRGDLAGVYDDIFYSRAFSRTGSFEWVFTFDNYTVPIAQYELVEGESVKSEELLWGYVRPGFGIGYRRQVSPGHQDNMAAVDLTIEPGFLFFDDGSKTAADFVVPHNGFEIREHLQLRWDALDRNIMSLPHRGFAAGADLVHGNRTNWENWGVNGSQDAGSGRDYISFTGYLVAAGGVPGIRSERDRLVGSLYGGVGRHLDRFSAPRIGGGVAPMGEEYGSTWRPILPGSVIQEFFPDHYVIATAEYRRELLFFTYLSFDASLGWLDRLKQTDNGVISKNGVFPAVGAKLTTGFLFNTRLQLAYNYNFRVIRNGHHGGHEIVFHFSHPI
jgi:hypothetical protein